MKVMRKISLIVACSCMMLLIFDSKSAFQGAKYGVELCAGSVIPSLFPFLVLSVFLVSSLNETDSSAVLLLSDLMGLPQKASPVLIPAFFGGYPVGAKTVTDMYYSGIISKQEAERLLAFCNNAGPSFLFGIVSVCFSDRKMILWLWLIHIMGAFCTALIYSARLSDSDDSGRRMQTKVGQDSMLSSVKAIGVICGWIILFRTFLVYLNKWVLWRLPDWFQVCIVGMLELTNGCGELVRIYDVRVRFIICSCMLAFGGICVLLQTASVTRGLSLRKYITGKLIHTGFSLAISSMIMANNGLMYALIICISAVALLKIKIKGRNKGFYPV